MELGTWGLIFCNASWAFGSQFNEFSDVSNASHSLGIGYFMVGLNIDKNHGIVTIGAIAKILVFIFFLAYFSLGVVQIDNVLIGTGDLIFAILFIEFLVNYKKL